MQRPSRLAAVVAPGAAPALSAGGFWPLPAVVFSALLISWAAEVAEFFMSRGLALALLAMLQVMPEFAVEAAIAHNAALNPDMTVLVTANFTGANRLLVGLGWPTVFLLAALSARRRGIPFKAIELERERSMEGVFLLAPTLYFLAIYARGSVGLEDTAVLGGIYAAYLWLLSRMAPEPEGAAEVVPGIPGRVLGMGVGARKGFVAAGFLGGGLLLFVAAEPFLGVMMGVAALFGVSAFFFVQWVAPALSEFPEFVAASRWAARVKSAPTAIGNLAAAQISQWTLLVAMIPVVFSLTLGVPGSIPLGELHGVQRVEILLTAAQSFAAVAILLKMRVTGPDAGVLFGLWFLQLVEPGLREAFIPIYFAFAAYQVIRHRREIRLFSDLRSVLKAHAVRRARQ